MSYKYINHVIDNVLGIEEKNYLSSLGYEPDYITPSQFQYNLPMSIIDRLRKEGRR